MNAVIIELKIDNREHKLVDYFTTRDDLPSNVKLTVSALDVGDVQLFYKDTAIVFERKTLSDLSQSIKDGRWHEQKQRLLGTHKSHDIIYVVEGTFDYVSEQPISGLNKNAFVSSLLNTLFRDDIKVVTTRHIADTIYFFSRLLDRVSKNPEEYYKCRDAVLETSYTPNVIKSRKKDNIDVRACFVMQLSCIPSISLKTADRIVDSLNIESMCELITYLKSHKNPVTELVKIPGIGHVLANTILRYLKIEIE